MGPGGRFYSYISLILMLGQVCSGVELPVQMRLRSIFVREVGSPDLHECFRGLTSSQRTPGFWGVTILVVRNEERCFKICDQVYGVSKSEGRTSSFFGIVVAY